MTYNGITTTNFLQDTQGGLPTVLQETVNGSNPSSFLYPLGSTTPLYQSNVSGTNSWYHSDGLGSVRAMTDGSSGAVQNGYSYNAFGTTSSQSGNAANSHQFAGEQLDPTGLYFNRARYYNPSVGRFISRDSYAGQQNNPLSQNRFVYTQDNPTNRVDPSGNRQVTSADVLESEVRGWVCGEARIHLPSSKVTCDLSGQRRLLYLAPIPGSTNVLDTIKLYPDMLIYNEQYTGVSSSPSGWTGGAYEVEPITTFLKGLLQVFVYQLRLQRLSSYYRQNSGSIPFDRPYYQDIADRNWQFGQEYFSFIRQSTRGLRPLIHVYSLVYGLIVYDLEANYNSPNPTPTPTPVPQPPTPTPTPTPIVNPQPLPCIGGICIVLPICDPQPDLNSNPV